MLNLQPLKLVVFKSCILWKRHWCLFIFEFLIPAVFFFLLAYGRSKISNYSQNVISETTVPDEKSGDLLLTQYFSVGETHIFYTPITNLTTNILKRVQIKFQLTNDAIEGFKSEDDLMKHYAINGNGTVMAILFNAADEKNLDYTLRVHEDHMSWDTHQLFYRVPDYIPDQGSSNYINRGILALQFAIDSSYIELLGNYEELPYTFFFQEFPYPPHKSDSFLSEMFMIFLPLITIFSFISLCPAVLKPIVEEKQTGSKELLKMAGLRPITLYLGWFLHAFMTYFISVCLIVFSMKVSLFGASYPPIEYCNGFIYFILLILYCAASIVFCMAMSTFFNIASIAMVCGILVWILSYFVPVSFLTETMPWQFKMILALLPNMALYFGYCEISVYEIRELGLNFKNLATPGSGSSQDLSFANILVMFAVQIILYALITIYVDSVYPGKYGMPKKFTYPISDLKQFINRNFKRSSVELINNEEETKLSRDVEDGRTMQKGIEIRDLVKSFGYKMAVNKLTLDVYDNQITVLLGHNGAGKTTTMAIVTGMIQATSGTVRIKGKDIRYNMDKIRKELGWCPQHNLIFPDFTVFEHFVYFGLLRGLSRSDAEQNAHDYMCKLNLKEKKNELAINLSGGMKRKLCLGLALTGNTKVLILDEPTSGLDPESRRKVWDMLKEVRDSRTLLITTHFMEEADVLGDWIAIMGNGYLIDYGTPMDLKNKYDTGYHLSLMLESTHDSLKEQLTEKIRSVIDDARLKYESGDNLVYVLPISEKQHFPELLKLLENFKIDDKNPIRNMSVTITTLEEVFQRSCDSIKVESNESSEEKFEKIEAAPHANWLSSIWRPLFRKRWCFIFRKWSNLVIHLAIAVLIMLLVAYLSRSSSGFYGKEEPEIEFNLKLYGETSVYYEISESESSTSMKNNYQSVAGGHKAKVYEVPSLTDAIIKEGEQNIAYYKYHMIVAAAFRNKDIYVMYANRALHGAPISLNIVMNTVLKTLFGSDHSIKTHFAPLRGVSTSLSSTELSEVQVGVLWMFLVPIAISFLIGSFLVFPNKEHITRFSQLQFMAGIPVCCYWLSNFLFDFIVLYLPSVILLSSTVALNESFRSMDVVGSLVVLLLCYGAACLPFAYLFSYKKSISSGFALFLIIGLFVGIVPTLAISAMEESQDEYYESLAHTLKYAFLPFLPHFGLTYTLLKFSRKVIQNYNWLVMPSKKKTFLCVANPNPCCYDHAMKCNNFRSYFIGDKFGIRNELLMAFVTWIFYMAIVMFVDSIYMKKLSHFICALITSVKNTFSNLVRNDSVRNNAVKQSPNRVPGEGTHGLFARNLYKNFFGKQVVKNVSLNVKQGKCFGLLGVNGAGKTTTFKMLTNEEIFDAGEVGISDDEYGTNIANVQYLKKISYCPQYDALNFVLSAKELLKIIAMMKGFNDEESGKLAENFLDLLELTPYANVPSGDLSGGNKRKLALGIALIGGSKYILLDEPTSGVDPSSRRKIWKIIDTWKKSKNAAFVLTSHSMDECEALCDDMAIMKEGEIWANGTVPELKKEYDTGFTLKLKLKSKSSIEPHCDIKIDDVNETTSQRSGKSAASGHNVAEGTDEVDGKSSYVQLKPLKKAQSFQSQMNPIDKRKIELKEKIENIFSTRTKDMDQRDIKLADHHEGMLHYHITSEQKWSELFGKIEELKQEFSDIIEDYTVSGTSLEDVFLSIARASTKSS